MDKKEELEAIDLAIAPNAGEHYSGIDAAVLSWIQQNVSQNVNRPTPTGFEDYYANAEGKTQLSDEQKQQIANVAAQGTSLLLTKLSERKKDEYRQALLASCGRKPAFGRKKRQKYFECVARFNKEFADKNKVANMPPAPPASSGSDKKDWYKNPVVIVGGIAGISLLAVYAIKTMKTVKPKVA